MTAPDDLREKVARALAEEVADRLTWDGTGYIAVTDAARIAADAALAEVDTGLAEKVLLLASAWEHQDRYFPSGPQYAVDLRALVHEHEQGVDQ